MALTLHYHPLSSFCQKALVALYEGDVAFTPLLVNLGDAQSRAAFVALWPLGKFPVLQDDARNSLIAESSIMIEYLAQHYPSARSLMPVDAAQALDVRTWDRFVDLYIHLPMQKIVGDRLRAKGERDATGVAQARAQMQTAYAILDAHLVGRTWLSGDDFTLADCAATAALYYGNLTTPFADYPAITAYFTRLLARPSFARVVNEAAPYWHMFPQEPVE